MKPRTTNALAWLQSRTGMPGAIKGFLNEEIPASSGWQHVFGSVALFLFLNQMFTGVLLALNYAAVPGDAYRSVKYIVTSVAAGRMIHSLHHWGSSAVIVLVAVHMGQVFITGAYRKPREATWAAGVVLLLFTLGFGLTGYLLPWDNRAYWGTVVTTKIASNAPVLGPYMERLLGSTGGIGVLTFSRFFALHVMILPLVTVLFIGLHLALIRRHGVAPVVGDARPRPRFYPHQLFRDTVAIFVTFAAVFLMALFLEAPLDRMADPTDTTYVPRPDWYFLFLFQSLKFFHGSLEPIGAVVLPGLAVSALFLLPFLDRSRIENLRRKILAALIAFCALAGWSALTWAAVASTPSVAPPASSAGLQVYQRSRCASCHSINGVGESIGPPLDGLAGRRSRDWVHRHFADPPALSPGSIMPAYHLQPDEEKVLTDYLFSLPRR